MPKPSILEDNFFGEDVVVQPKLGRQPDGSFVKKDGTVLPPKEPRREPYPEPEDLQVDGHEEVVQTPDGAVSFLARRMTKAEFSRAGFLNRKRLDLVYSVVEVYSGKPRPQYSYDELEQLRRGELKR